MRWISDTLGHQARVKEFERILQQDWYTVKEAAKALGVHEKTVRGWIRAGDLKATRPSPRKTRILKSDLAAYLARRGE